jgi:hypothetical protein
MAFGAAPAACGGSTMCRSGEPAIRRAGDRVIRRPAIWGYGDSVIG